MSRLFRTYYGNMELKNYQKAVIDRLEEYLKAAKESAGKNPAKAAFIEITDKPYHILTEDMPNVPFVCIKVPTGGIWGGLNDKYKFIMVTKSDIEGKINKIKDF